MRAHPYLVAGGLLLALAACRPGAAEYTEAQAPNNLVVDNASARLDLHFVPGSAHLYRRDAWRLASMAANGMIAPSDRVMVAAAGPPALAAARVHTVATELLRYNIVATGETLAGVPPNHALVETGRYMVTLPACPNWSKEAVEHFTNTDASNFGCANETDLGMSVANPADLAEGRPVGLTEGEPAVGAVDRYLTDKVTLPAAAALGPISAPAAAAPTGGGAGAAP